MLIIIFGVGMLLKDFMHATHPCHHETVLTLPHPPAVFFLNKISHAKSYLVSPFCRLRVLATFAIECRKDLPTEVCNRSAFMLGHSIFVIVFCSNH
jgi:hypothetical protein